MTIPALGDIVIVQDGDVQRIGQVRRVIERNGEQLVQICYPGAEFGRVVEVIERAVDPEATIRPAKEGPCLLGQTVRFEPWVGADQAHEGVCFGVHRLRSGKCLVRIGGADHGLFRLAKSVGGAK
jgi:hypothetical protein